MEIIDFRVRPQTPYFYRNIWPDTIPAFQPYVKLFKATPGDDRLSHKPVEQSIEQMAGHGISRAVIFAGDADGNLEVSKICKQHPDTYVGLAGVDIRQGTSKGVEDLERAYTEYGLLGLSLSPFSAGIPPDDPRYYPLYALSERMGKVFQCHSAIHYNPAVRLDIADPTLLDRIAVHFPNLKIVMSHAGFGFGDLGVTVALRHPNMYMDFTGLHPRYLPERLLHMANSLLRKRVLFGTNYPCLQYDIVEEWRQFIQEPNQPLFFAENAKRVLGLK
jgi:predicted TIM-barrel fold metal-dependent hydrolase